MRRARDISGQLPGLLVRRLTLILLFNSLLAVWLLAHPGPHALVANVDDLAQTLGPLLAVVMLAYDTRRLWQHGGAPAGTGTAGTIAAWGAGRRWAPLLLGLGALSFAVGQAIWSYYEEILHQPTPFPSWADAAFLSAYPFMLLGILLLPARRVLLASRTRVVMDGLMIMTAMVTFSWCFVLGPTFLQGSETAFGQIVGTAYPFCDLVLIFCLFLLSARSGDRALRPVVGILSVALGLIVVTDSVFDFENLHGTYVTGGLVDVGWPLGYMLVCLGGTAAWLARREEASDTAVSVPALWRSLLPYALVPAVAALALYTRFQHGDDNVETGVYIGGALLIVLVLLRQVLALLENGRLLRQVEAKNREAEQLNVELRAANERLETLATTDPLTGLPNHRAMVAALDQELERGHRYGRPCAVVFMDLDHFKALNDGCGHHAGDAVLREFGSIARAVLRGIDTLGRWGGEEFVALLPETDVEAACAAAEHIRAAVAAHPFTAGARLTCSLGVAVYPRDADKRDSLLDGADRAMYAAKRLGRNQVRRWDDPAVVALMGAADAHGTREETALIGTVEALAALVEARDRYTGEHTLGVATLSVQLALALGLDAAEARMVGLAGRLHDVGKIAVPDAVLQKTGSLTEDEWVLLRTHPVVGADVVSHVPALRVLAPIIRAHHEHWDGGGYPDKLAGAAIPLGARIVAVADAYGAMTTTRPYQPARDAAWALAEARRCAGTQFDPAVIAALERILSAPGAATTPAA